MPGVMEELEDLKGELHRLTADNERLQARILELETPDYEFNAEDWEYTYGYNDSCLDDFLLDAMAPGEILQVGRLHRLKDVFIVLLPDDDDNEWASRREFVSWEEAESAVAAWRAKEAECPD